MLIFTKPKLSTAASRQSGHDPSEAYVSATLRFPEWRLAHSHFSPPWQSQFVNLWRCMMPTLNREKLRERLECSASWSAQLQPDTKGQQGKRRSEQSGLKCCLTFLLHARVSSQFVFVAAHPVARAPHHSLDWLPHSRMTWSVSLASTEKKKDYEWRGFGKDNKSVARTAQCRAESLFT